MIAESRLDDKFKLNWDLNKKIADVRSQLDRVKRIPTHCKDLGTRYAIKKRYVDDSIDLPRLNGYLCVGIKSINFACGEMPNTTKCLRDIGNNTPDEQVIEISRASSSYCVQCN